MGITNTIQSAIKVAVDIFRSTESTCISGVLEAINNVRKEKHVSKKIQLMNHALDKVKEFIRRHGESAKILLLKNLLEKILRELWNELKEKNRFIHYIELVWQKVIPLIESGESSAVLLGRNIKEIIDLIKSKGGVFEDDLKQISTYLRSAIRINKTLVKDELLQKELALAWNELKKIKKVFA